MKARSFLYFAAIASLGIFSAPAQNSADAIDILTTGPGAAQLAAVKPSGEFEWASLYEGTDTYHNYNRYQWDAVPRELKDLRFLRQPAHAGVLDFTVASGGYVYMIVSTRWGGGGNDSGDWKHEVLSERDIRREGWKPLRGVRGLSTTDTGEMAIFYRYCEAGETHRIRTEKYVAPMLLIQ